MKTAVIYIGEGIGNIVMSTPMIQAFHKLGYKIYTHTRPSSPAGMEVLEGWNILQPPPHPRDPDLSVYTYWFRPNLAAQDDTEKSIYTKTPEWTRISEIDLNMELARRMGYTGETPNTYVPCLLGPEKVKKTIDTAVAPNCFPNEHSRRKMWPHWSGLLPNLGKVALLGAEDDFRPSITPTKTTTDYRGLLPLNVTKQIILQSKIFIGNDGGLAHIAAALGVKTYIIFGYTSQLKVKPPQAIAVTKGLPCQPCQYSVKTCKDNECLDTLSAEEVYEQI